MIQKKEKLPYIIKLKEVVKEFDGKIVLDNIELNIKKGDFVTLLGHLVVVRPLF